MLGALECQVPTMPIHAFFFFLLSFFIFNLLLKKKLFSSNFLGVNIIKTFSGTLSGPA